ncbi:MAG: cyclase family protein [Methanomicrobiales archaeon]|nr:cyclase family protein [Methanomicrobiales archaeon]
MLIPLSYPLTRSSPLYPGTPPPVVKPHRPRSSGAPPRSSIITVHSHSGTHIDLPLHFCDNKAVKASLSHEDLIFSPARCIELPMDPASAITPQHLSPHLSAIRTTEALFIRTGSFLARSSDPKRYASSHPWVDPSLPSWLRTEVPGLRLFGIDTISIASPPHREEGRACHRGFLCGPHPILILEDVNLTDDRILVASWKLVLFPLLSEEIDGLPVVAIAELG